MLISSRYFTFFVLAILSQVCSVYALGNDPLRNTIEAAAAAIRVQEERIKIASENIANEDTTGTIEGEKPYRRKVLIAKNIYDPKKRNKLLKVYKYDFDKSDFKMKYDPNHPAADANGYVQYPNVNKEIEIGDIREAKNAHAANLAIINTTKQMIKDTIDLMK